MPRAATLVSTIALAAACAAAQTVEGRVINSATGQGIPGVKVYIAQSELLCTLTTDASGRFSQDKLKDGSYTARYDAPDYWPDMAGTRPAASIQGGFLAIQLTQRFQVIAGSGPVNLEARLIPLGRITGRVVDGRGKPLPSRLELAGRGIRLSTPSSQNGSFDLHRGILPGAYLLCATPAASLKPPDPEPETGRTLAWVRTCYPAAASLEAASKIIVEPGATADVELKLLALPVHAIRGVLLDPENKPAPDVNISLGYDLPLMKTKSAADGGFEFPAAPDGAWTISAQTDRDGVSLQARERVEISGRDLDRLKILLSAPIAFSGRVVMEIPQGMTPPAPPSSIRLDEVMGVNEISGRNLTVRPDAQGNFTVTAYPGVYNVSVPKPVAPLYLDSIRAGGVESLDGNFRLAAPAILTLTYKTNGGSVRGSVENCGGGKVWLFPQDPRLTRFDLRFSANCDPNDRYEIPAVRPGDYYAIALGGFTPWIGDNIADALILQAAKVTVRSGETSSADLRLIIPDPFR